jgi:hypothetical protein
MESTRPARENTNSWLVNIIVYVVFIVQILA